jgi:hypothetical protein
MKRKLLILLAVAMVALTSLLLQDGSSIAQSGTTFDSPFFTPMPPTPTPPSAEAQRALEYISEREGIPIEGLFIGNDYEWAFPLIGRTFRAVTILDVRTDHGQEYNVLVDLADGSIEDDVNAIIAAEEAAYQAKCGKFYSSLCDRLQEVGDDDLLTVAITVRVAPSIQDRAREEVYARLTAQYPEAAQALERDELPWDVDDPDLRREIRGEYRRMWAEQTAVWAGPLIDDLSERGFEVGAHGVEAPVAAVLPKKVIVELAEREDVKLIYLISESGWGPDAAGTAASTGQALAAWKQALSGWGGLVAAAVVWGLALLLIYLSRWIGGLARKRLLWVILVAATLLSLPLLYLTCQPRENALPFETIERLDEGGTGERWEAKEPGLVVIATSEDLTQVNDLFTKDAQAQLYEVDFGIYFAIAAFLGRQGSIHEGIDIEQVLHWGDKVSVYVQVGRPGFGAMETSPYHLVKVRKEGNWNQTIQFTLYMDGTEATSLSHFIP